MLLGLCLKERYRERFNDPNILMSYSITVLEGDFLVHIFTSFSVHLLESIVLVNIGSELKFKYVSCFDCNVVRSEYCCE